MLLFSFEIRKLSYSGTGIFETVVVCYYDKMTEGKKKPSKLKKGFVLIKTQVESVHRHWLYCFCGCGEVGYHCLRSCWSKGTKNLVDAEKTRKKEERDEEVRGGRV